MCMHREKVAICNPRGTLWRNQSYWEFNLQNYEEIHCFCLTHPVSSNILLQQAQQNNKNIEKLKMSIKNIVPAHFTYSLKMNCVAFLSLSFGQRKTYFDMLEFGLL